MLFDGQSNISLLCEGYYRLVASGGNSGCGVMMATKRFNAEQLRYFHSSGFYNQKNQSQSNKKSKRQGKNRGRLSYRFVDRTRVRVSGGSGGKGSTSMLRIGRKMARRPDGGHGGSGGSVIIVADPTEQTLCWTRPHVTAESGSHGSSQKMNGKNGKNLILRVPCGVVVRRVLDHDEEWDDETKSVIRKKQIPFDFDDSNDDDSSQHDYGFMYDNDDNTFRLDQSVTDDDDHYDRKEDEITDEEYDYDQDVYSFDNDEEHYLHWGDREKVVLADLDEAGSYVVVAKGGRGGIGSSHFLGRSSSFPSPQVIAQYATPSAGEKAALELELKLIADVGLVGFPNAGKSSLLAAMSRATPHIAPYPFTTLHPLVGYIEYKDGFRVCAADVPGLIAGASEGRGKGHDFLRHLERTKALLFIVDAAGVDGRDPLSDLKTLTEELSSYGEGDMMNRRSLVVANKMDLLTAERKTKVLRDLAGAAEEFGIRLHGDVQGISAGVSGEGLAPLSESIRTIVTLSEADRQIWDKRET